MPHTQHRKGRSMTFTKHVIPEPIYGSQFDDIWWESGIYMIRHYDHIRDLNGKPGYAAYYKPDGWKNWGMRVDRSTQWYKTLEAAKQACEVHALAEGVAA